MNNIHVTGDNATIVVNQPAPGDGGDKDKAARKAIYLSAIAAATLLILKIGWKLVLTHFGM